MREARIRKGPRYGRGRPGAATHYLQATFASTDQSASATGAPTSWLDEPATDDIRWGSCFAPSPHVSTSVLDREAMLLDQENGRTYTLNPVGTLVWELLDGRRPLAGIVSALAENFDAPEPQLRHDLIELVREFKAEHLIEERR